MQIFIALLVVCVALLFIWLKYLGNYWERRGIPQNKTQLLVGNMGKWKKSKHISQIFTETYRQFKGQGPFAGFHFFMIRSALILDLDLVRNILVKDFQNFRDRGIFYNERDDPLTGNLFFLDGEKWHRLRHKMSPTFTSGKMKYMFTTVARVGEDLRKVFSEKVENAASSGHVLEVTDLLGRFTADVIGTCAFGLECNSLQNPEADFVSMGKKFLLERRHNAVVDGLMQSFPDLARKLHMRIIQDAVHDFYMRIVRDTIDYRKKNDIKRNDFMNMLIDMIKKTDNQEENAANDDGLTVEEIAAQAFVFFIAGFETSSTTMGFALYELAQNQAVQDKVRAEINEVLARHKDEFTYECMHEMQYLDQVIDETLRMYPVVGHLIRRARTRYETNDPKFFIEKGTMVIIPSIAIHYDPEYYPEPHTFRPERFSAEQVQQRAACTWLPFGEGPRNCIGMRFGKMQTCIGLTYLLKHFKFSVASQTEIPYKLITKSFLLSSENGIHLKVEPIA